MTLEEISIVAGLIGDAMNLSLAFMTLYLSVVTGYLIAAYLVGSRLTIFQAAFITLLFVVFSVHFTLSGFGAFEAAYAAHLKFSSDAPVGPSPIMNRGLAAFQLAGVIGCLKFMWDVRNPKP